jgi:hypothetical protein
MHRRSFLGLLGAGVAAPFLPTPEVPTCGVDLASTRDVAGLTVIEPRARGSILVTTELLEDAAFDFDQHYRRGHFDWEHEIWELHAR